MRRRAGGNATAVGRETVSGETAGGKGGDGLGGGGWAGVRGGIVEGVSGPGVLYLRFVAL